MTGTPKGSGHDFIFFAQCYLITRAYALEVIERYDRPVTERVTSEVIIRASGGFIAAEPLVLEDCIASVRAPHDCPYHLKQFCYWNWNNFPQSDFDQRSPLAHCKPEMAWPSFPRSFGIEAPNQSSEAITQEIEALIAQYYSQS